MKTVNNYIETDLGNVAPNPRGEYVLGQTYEYLDWVTIDGSTYLCLVDETTKPPKEGQTTPEWQVTTLAGGLTPEYIALHDNVVNKAEEVEGNANAVNQALNDTVEINKNVKLIETNVTEMQSNVQANKNSVVGYAKSVAESERKVKESEQNVNLQVSGFDQHVINKTNEADVAIDKSRQEAIDTVVTQQDMSVQEVKDQTSAYITTEKNNAKQEIDAKINTFDVDVNNIISQVDAKGNEKKEEINTLTTQKVEEVTNEGTVQKQLVTGEGTKQIELIKSETFKFEADITDLKKEKNKIYWGE